MAIPTGSVLWELVLYFPLPVILNDNEREQDHSQSEDIQFDTVQNGNSDVDASAADLLLALVSKPRKHKKQKPVNVDLI